MTAISTPTLPSGPSIIRARTILELRLFTRDRRQLVFGFFYPAIMMNHLWFSVQRSDRRRRRVLGIAASNLPKSGASASTVIVPIALVLQFISGVVFVYTSLPGWMQQIAAIFPLKWMTQGLRAAFLPAARRAEITGSWEYGRTAPILLAWTVGGLVLSTGRSAGASAETVVES